ncbi:hypothetical protein BKA56DRAFT_614360 [Ilyonectria sp. MPI-CAGE-AT-0026]|nr:hypothetical protein BKA56DRAFT_614360 [Ilyonectria sp. MPI-CAGE-AT-0026]
MAKSLGWSCLPNHRPSVTCRVCAAGHADLTYTAAPAAGAAAGMTLPPESRGFLGTRHGMSVLCLDQLKKVHVAVGKELERHRGQEAWEQRQMASTRTLAWTASMIERQQWLGQAGQKHSSTCEGSSEVYQSGGTERRRERGQQTQTKFSSAEIWQRLRHDLPETATKSSYADTKSTITATNVDATSWFACVHIRGWQTQGLPPTPNAIPATPNTATHVTTHTLHYLVQVRPSNKTRLLQRERLHLRVRVRFSPSASTARIEQFSALAILPYETLPHQQPAPRRWRAEVEESERERRANAMPCHAPCFMYNVPGAANLLHPAAPSCTRSALQHGAENSVKKTQSSVETANEQLAGEAGQNPAVGCSRAASISPRLCPQPASQPQAPSTSSQTHSINRSRCKSCHLGAENSKGFSASATSLVKASGACVSPRHGLDSALIDRRRGQAVEMIARKWVAADWDDPVLDRESHAWAPAFPFSRYQRTASSVQRTIARSTKAQIVCLFWGITVSEPLRLLQASVS